MAEAQARNPFVNWVIAIGAIGAVALIWFAMGRPGVADLGQDIYDGRWSCEQPGGNGLGAMGGPGITVSGGEVTSASYFDIKNGKDLPVGFGNVQIVNTTKLTLTSVYPPMYDIASGTYKFLDEQATFECTKD